LSCADAGRTPEIAIAMIDIPIRNGNLHARYRQKLVKSLVMCLNVWFE
jgi:hypothetical protein